MQGEMEQEQSTGSGDQSRSALWVWSGARAVEAGLIAEVAALCEEARRDPRLLAQPVRIVVASDRLRRQIAAKLTQEFGTSLVGVVVQTLFYVAQEALARSRVDATTFDLLFAALVREAVQSEAGLLRELPQVFDFVSERDGREGLLATVHDLIDAGFEPDLEEVLQEHLATQGSHRGVRRAQAIVRIAAKVLREFDRLGVSHRANLLRRATQCIRDNPSRALPSRAIRIHGFADATGVATDLLEALMQHFDAKCFWDWPRDPAPLHFASGTKGEECDQHNSMYDRGRAWGEPLQERLRGATGKLVEKSNSIEQDPTTICVVRASGLPEEVREAARRVQELRDTGMAVERIAIAARDIETYATLLRRELTRLGIPFSAPDVRGPRHHDGNYLLQLAQLLRERGEARIELWISLCGAFVAPTVRADWLSAMTILGVLRVRDLAQLEDPEKVRIFEYGSFENESPEATGAESSRPSSKKHSAAVSDILQLRAQCLRAQARWNRWPERASLEQHQKELEKFLSEVLGCEDWQERFFAERGGLSRDWPSACEVAYSTFVKLFEEQAETFGRLPFGGQGGGVQILSVMDARACAFDSLFVLGVQRGVFPRLVTEDALLVDSLRSALRDVLPDLSLKRRAFEEERFLFAQLCGSARQVTLSYSAVDSDGKSLHSSPFIERLRLAGVAQEENAREILISPAKDSAPAVLRTAFEASLQAGLHGTRESFQRNFVLATQDAETILQQRLLAENAFAKSAAARIRILEELDPADSARRDDLGTSPYQGFVDFADLSEMRSPLPWVTKCEKLARCPWQFFLESVLKISAVGDLRTSLFDRDVQFGGNLVHAVLDRIANEERGERRGKETLSEPRPVRWPTAERLEALWQESLERKLREEKSSFREGLRVQSEAWKEFLEVARGADWPTPESVVGVLETEWTSSILVEDARARSRKLRFRADRVDRVGDTLRFTDYKTGKNSYEQKTPTKRLEHFVEDLRQGNNLQASAYVRAEQVQGMDLVVGRYLYLKPEQSGEMEVDSENAEVASAFRESLAWIFELWDRGVFFPRTSPIASDKAASENKADRKASKGCAYCSVQAACHQGDFGFRVRLEAWADANREALAAKAHSTDGADALHCAFQKAWNR